MTEETETEEANKTTYCGQTTSYSHYQAEQEAENEGAPVTDWSAIPADGCPAIDQETILRVQWSDCPIEVANEVQRLWVECELRDNAYFSWDRTDEVYHYLTEEDETKTMADHYPIIDAFLQAAGLSTILINWWK